jgi:hypothetical protein
VTRDAIDALIDGHYRAEATADVAAILDGFGPHAEHDVAGRPGDRLYGMEQIAGYYRTLLSQLRIERFETLRRWYGDAHAVDESILHGTAIGTVFGLDGRGRTVAVRLLHVFDFADGLISRESAWLDLAAVQRQLA